MFHQQLAGHAQLVADGTTAGVGTPHQGLVLQKKTFMSCNSSKTGLKYARTIRPLPDSARVKEKKIKSVAAADFAGKAAGGAASKRLR